MVPLKYPVAKLFLRHVFISVVIFTVTSNHYFCLFVGKILGN